MKIILSFIIFFGTTAHSQGFSDYRMRYDHFEDNDVRAFQYINPYIQLAKKKKNFPELFQAYKDAVSFTPTHKLAYADSLIWAAAQTRNHDLMATAYLTKGTIYYFTYRKFQPALDEYLHAWHYAQHSSDPYLYYKNLYHIGVIKSYLGYYDDALAIFKKCQSFFSKETTSSDLQNLKFNHKKGYLNTLHQLGVCFLEDGKLEEVQRIIQRGLQSADGGSDFYLERSYFYNLKGIVAYHQQQDSVAISSLSNALPGLEKKEDFTNASLVYFFKGKSYERLHQQKEALLQFQKIDSIFQRYQFILPQVREAYEILITHYRVQEDKDLELYYTTQLLKADHILSTDFKYLASKLHKEYDTGDLVAAKKRLETSFSYLTMLGIILGVLVLLSVLYVKLRRKKRLPPKKPSLPLVVPQVQHVKSDEDQLKTTKVPPEVVSAVLEKLQTLEKGYFFLEKGITLHKLAGKLQTNSTYLSVIINEHKGCSFATYLKQLRLQYVFQKLREDKHWRRYSIETLAHECGFTDRTHFSRAFADFYKLSLVEYIRKCTDESSSQS